MDRKGMCEEGKPNRGLHGHRTTEGKPVEQPHGNLVQQAPQNAKWPPQPEPEITDLRGKGGKRYI